MAYSESDTRSKLKLTARAIEKQLANRKKENRLQRVRSAKKDEWVVNERGDL
jgi:predicted HTH transcriptional regulator